MANFGNMYLIFNNNHLILFKTKGWSVEVFGLEFGVCRCVCEGERILLPDKN